MVKLFTSPNYQRWRNLICFALVLLAFLGALDLAIGSADPKAYSPLQTLPQGDDLQGNLGVSIKVTPPSSNPDDPAVITLTEVLVTGNTTRLSNPVAGQDLSAPKYSRICVQDAYLVQVVSNKASKIPFRNLPDSACGGLQPYSETENSPRATPGQPVLPPITYHYYVAAPFPEDDPPAATVFQQGDGSPFQGSVNSVGPGIASFDYPFDSFSLTFSIVLSYTLYGPASSTIGAPERQLATGTTYLYDLGTVDHSDLWSTSVSNIDPSVFGWGSGDLYDESSGFRIPNPITQTQKVQFVQVHLQRPRFTQLIIPAVVVVVLLFILLLAFLVPLDEFLGAGTAVFFGIFGLSTVLSPPAGTLLAYAISALYVAFAVVVVRFLIRSIAKGTEETPADGAKGTEETPTKR